MLWDNLAVAANFFVEIAVELIVLFIGITFLVGLIQEYVSDETIKKALGGRRKILGSILGAGFGLSRHSAHARPYPCYWGCSMLACLSHLQWHSCLPRPY